MSLTLPSLGTRKVSTCVVFVVTGCCVVAEPTRSFCGDDRVRVPVRPSFVSGLMVDSASMTPVTMAASPAVPWATSSLPGVYL
jgi:hypothetical protein